jgi:hypothetical protein
MLEAARLRRPLDITIIYFSVCNFYLSREWRTEVVHMLVEGFDIFGVRIQYWMLIAVAMVGIAVLVELRRR